MELTDAQKREFAERGIIKLPGVVPEELVGGALRAINGSLGEKGINPDDLPRFRSQTYCPELCNTPVIRDLYNATSISTIAESLIGPGMVAPVGGGQIALRFPSPNFAEPERVHGPHIDGMYSPNNGVPKGTIGNFTALVGIFLSDLPGPFRGNFTTWPGTHLQHEAYFREHGHEALLNGMPTIDLPEPEQFIGKAGDAAIVHYLLGHSIAVNVSPHVRYAIFFRIFHTEHESQKWETMTDAWLEWPGIRAVL
jgi:hypothetical protein